MFPLLLLSLCLLLCLPPLLLLLLLPRLLLLLMPLVLLLLLLLFFVFAVIGAHDHVYILQRAQHRAPGLRPGTAARVQQQQQYVLCSAVHLCLFSLETAGRLEKPRVFVACDFAFFF